jgi:hypothetical protein
VLSDSLCYFATVFNGSGLLVVTGRDTDATWRSLATFCRERDWSRPRLLQELQNGLPYRTIPPGHVIDWRHYNVERSLDLAASTVMIVLPVLMADGVPDLDCRTIGVEVAPQSDVEMPATTGSAQWAIAATRRLKDESKIPEGVTKAELGRLLEAEARKAVRAGQLGRALKASYLEDQLAPWGIWPLNSFE